MKTLMRFVGTVVVVLVLAGFVLYKLNTRGFISGNLSHWVTVMTEHITSIKNETEKFLHEEGYLLPTATIDPNAPQG